MAVMQECIPRVRLPKRHNLPWLSKNLKRAMQKWNAKDELTDPANEHVQAEKK